MNEEDKADVLSRVGIFESLDRQELLDLAKAVEDREYQSGERLYAQGDTANELWIVAKGGVALSVMGTSGDEEIVDTRRPPAAFGEAALYDEKPRMVSARAVEDTHVLVLEGARFKELVRSHPDVAEALLRHMASVIRRTAERN